MSGDEEWQTLQPEKGILLRRLMTFLQEKPFHIPVVFGILAEKHIKHNPKVFDNVDHRLVLATIGAELSSYDSTRDFAIIKALLDAYMKE